MKNYRSIFLVGLSAISIQSSAAIVTFDDLGLGSNSVYHPGPTAGLASNENLSSTFNSGGATFTYSFTNFGDFGSGPCCWEGFTHSSISSEVDATGTGGAPLPDTGGSTPPGGILNEFRAITGDGSGIGADAYGLAYANTSVTFGSAVQLSSADFTNNNYAYYSMTNGDTFGISAYTSSDYFNLIIEGLDSNGASTGTSVTVALASGLDILSTWETVNLSALGIVHGIAFSYDAQQIYTPSYFAIDNLAYQAVPAPAAAWLLASSLLSGSLSRNISRR